MNIIDEIYNLDDKIIELESKRQDLLNNKEIYFISIKRKDLSPLSKIFKRILKNQGETINSELLRKYSNISLINFLSKELCYNKVKDLYIIIDDPRSTSHDPTIYFLSTDIEIIINIMKLLRLDMKHNINYENIWKTVPNISTIRRMLKIPNLNKKIKSLILTLNPINIELAKQLLKNDIS